MSTQEDIASGIEGLSEFGKESASTVSVAFSEWLGNYGRVQQETIRFMRDRFLKDFDMLAQFALCKKPEEFLQLQTKFLSEMLSDYAAESAKTVALLGNAIPGGASGNRPSARRSRAR